MTKFYERVFMKLSLCFFQYTIMEANIAQVQNIGDLEYNHSNSTFTLNDFYNTFHYDKNYNS